jgi:hypothetical protein
MTNALLSPVLHEIHVSVVSAEEASLRVAEFWSRDRLIGFTRIEDGDLALRIGPSPIPWISACRPWLLRLRRRTASSPSTETRKRKALT